MKMTVTLLLLFTLFSVNVFAQDYTQFSLPEGAKARLGKGSIHEIQYSPDGTRLAVAGSIGIWIYDTMTYQEVALLTGHTDFALNVSFSPDGNTIASGNYDGTIRLWDATTGALKQTLTGHTDIVNSVSFSSDGNTIASGSNDDTVRLWNVRRQANTYSTLTGHTSRCPERIVQSRWKHYSQVGELDQTTRCDCGMRQHGAQTYTPSKGIRIAV